MVRWSKCLPPVPRPDVPLVDVQFEEEDAEAHRFPTAGYQDDRSLAKTTESRGYSCGKDPEYGASHVPDCTLTNTFLTHCTRFKLDWLVGSSRQDVHS